MPFNLVFYTHTYYDAWHLGISERCVKRITPENMTLNPGIEYWT